MTTSDQFLSAPETAITTIKRFITGSMLRSGMEGYVIGLSGGIDSALSAALAVAAVGSEKVSALMLPFRNSSPQSRHDAEQVAATLGIQSRVIDISPMIDAYYPAITEENRLRAGNKMARERMAILFDIAHERRALVLGTGNRTEICLGYTTWYGDSACSINPLGELYKTEVRLLANIMKLPSTVITKAPTADLWAGQTDEGEIGVSYETIDQILIRLVDQGVFSLDALVKEGFNPTDVSRVISLLNRNDFKRRLPPIAPLGRPAIPDRIQVAE